MLPDAQATLTEPGGDSVWFALFRLPEDGEAWEYRDLRLSAQDLAMRNIAKTAPSAVVIAFQGSTETAMDRARKVGKRLIEDLRYSSRCCTRMTCQPSRYWSGTTTSRLCSRFSSDAASSTIRPPAGPGS